MKNSTNTITQNPLLVQINSEVGNLEEVIIHRPGSEIENMTPENAQRALYSDILNLEVVKEEYAIFEAVLRKTCKKVYVLKDLLFNLLEEEENKLSIVSQVCQLEKTCAYRDTLLSLSASKLASVLMEGLPMVANNLTNYLSRNRFAMPPLHNALFVRDAATSIWNTVMVSRMANKIRQRESYIMDAVFTYHFNNKTVNPEKNLGLECQTHIEGGDVMVISDKVLLIGIGKRTTAQGVDFIINQLKRYPSSSFDVIVQELPDTLESFIHLDMVFSLVDKETCVAYTPLLLNNNNKYQTITLSIEHGEVNKISTEKNILTALRKTGHDLKLVACGGQSNIRNQEREQWHSGTNFLALAPGKVIGYSRNIYTLEELSKTGYEIIKACDVASGKITINNYNRCVVSLDGTELARGGGGARCMSLPVNRAAI